MVAKLDATGQVGQDACGYLSDAVGDLLVVDDSRGDGLALDLCLAAHGFSNTVDHLVEALQHYTAHFRLEGADGAGQLGVGRDDVERLAGAQGGDADHGCFERRHVAGRDALQGCDDMGGCQHRVDRQVRHGAVPAFARDADLEHLSGCHHCPSRRSPASPAVSRSRGASPG